MYWKKPPIIKIYEAPWALVDKRVKIVDTWTILRAEVVSSLKNKTYNVSYDGKNAIMANDNGSYYVWYLWYPSIAVLFERWILEVDSHISACLSGIAWKKINQKHNNDFTESKKEIESIFMKQWWDKKRLLLYTNIVLAEIMAMRLKYLWEKQLPPQEL